MPRRRIRENEEGGHTVMVLQLDGVMGVEGTCSVPGFEGGIEVLAYSWGMSSSRDRPHLPSRIQKALKKIKAQKAAEKARRKAEEKEAKKAAKESRKVLKEEQQARSAAASSSSSSLFSSVDDDDDDDDDEEENDDGGYGGGYGRYGGGGGDDDDDDIDYSNPKLAYREDELEYGSNRINVQDISMTKYVDTASNAMMLMMLASKKGFNATFTCLAASPIKKQEDSKKAKKKEDADADGASKAESSASPSDGAAADKKDAMEEEGEEEEEEKFSYRVRTQIKLRACALTSISTGGSGGEYRFTENVTLSFGGISVTQIQPGLHIDKSTPVPYLTSTIDYNILTKKAREVGPDKKQLLSAIKQTPELDQVNTVLLGYLNH